MRDKSDRAGKGTGILYTGWSVKRPKENDYDYPVEI